MAEEATNLEIPPEWQARDAELRARAAEEEQGRLRFEAYNLRRRREATGVPIEFLDVITGGRLRDTEPVQQLAREPFVLLVLAGDVGRGKSLAAANWALGALGKGKRDPLYVTAAKLSRWDRYDNAEMDKLLKAGRLVIDDLGNEFSDTKGNFLAILDEAIADRVANKRPTVITTNLTRENFRKRYDARIDDRIRGFGRYEVSAGPSIRGRDLGVGAGPAR